MVCEEARRLKEEALLNTEEDARFGESLREELRHREDRLAAIVAAKERAAQREAHAGAARTGSVKAGGHRGEPEDKAQSNFTDPDSAKTGAEGFQHNAQVAGEHQLIVATEPTNNASDQGRGCEVEETFDEQPGTVLTGYCNERDLSVLEACGGYVAPGREGKRTVNRDPHTHPATHG